MKRNETELSVVRIKNLSKEQIDSILERHGRINIILGEPRAEGAFIKRITIDDLICPEVYQESIKMYFLFSNSPAFRGGWTDTIKPEVFDGMEDAWSFHLPEFPNLIISNSDLTLYDLIK